MANPLSGSSSSSSSLEVRSASPVYRPVTPSVYMRPPTPGLIDVDRRTQLFVNNHTSAVGELSNSIIDHFRSKGAVRYIAALGDGTTSSVALLQFGEDSYAVKLIDSKIYELHARLTFPKKGRLEGELRAFDVRGCPEFIQCTSILVLDDETDEVREITKESLEKEEGGFKIVALLYEPVELLKNGIKKPYKSLADYIQERYADRNPLSIDEVRKIMFQILSGLKKLAAKGIMHRDMKLENILICEDGSIKIADFGYAKKIQMDAAGTRERRHSTCGSPEFIAPDLVALFGSTIQEFDEKADVWSAGIIMYTLLFGELPYKAATMRDQFIFLHNIGVRGGCTFSKKDLDVLSLRTRGEPLERYSSLVLRWALHTKPHDRMSAHQLLEMPFFDSLRGGFRISEEKDEGEFSV